MAINYAELKLRFNHHKPKRGQAGRYENIRSRALTLARYIVAHTPESREQSMALTHLEQAVFYANAAIARREM